MPKRTCTVDGCARAHAARGLCSTHYSYWHREHNGRKPVTYTIACRGCGVVAEVSSRAGRYCSIACKGDDYRLKVSPLPEDHPVMILVAAQKAAAAESKRLAKQKPEWRTPRECGGCGGIFCPRWTPHQLTCSQRCARRVHRWRRRAAEANAAGTFTWSEFMRVAHKFGYRCAYCGEKPGRLDPDHVVPLSRGGINSTTNLLPACPTCNGHKRDLLLNEWARDREARGLPERVTSWSREDSRYWHLTQALLAA